MISLRRPLIHALPSRIFLYRYVVMWVMETTLVQPIY